MRVKLFCCLKVRLHSSCIEVFFCLIVFSSNHRLFFSLFKVRQHANGCFNHDIKVGLCSELLMRLSFYIIYDMVKSFPLTWGSNRGPSDCAPSIIPLYQSANSCFLFESSFYVRLSDLCNLFKVRHVMGTLTMT